MLNNPIKKIDPSGLADSGKALWGNVTPGQIPAHIPMLLPINPSDLIPSKQFLEATAFGGHTFAWASGALQAWPAAIGFALVGQTAISLKSLWYSNNPCEDAMVDTIESVTPDLPPGAQEMERKIIEKAVRQYIKDAAELYYD